MRVLYGVKCNANQVCKLNKAFYEPKQATGCNFRKSFDRKLRKDSKIHLSIVVYAFR